MDDTEDERVRLHAEISAAQARVVAAKERASARDAEARAALRAEVVAARTTVAEMERLHAEAVAMIRDTARAEADRILAEALELAAGAAPETFTLETVLSDDVQ